MNGRYTVVSGEKEAPEFNDDYASKGHEYFDVYSPELATQYAEVFWTDLGNTLIPQHIIDRFNGKQSNKKYNICTRLLPQNKIWVRVRVRMN